MNISNCVFYILDCNFYPTVKTSKACDTICYEIARGARNNEHQYPYPSNTLFLIQ